MSLRTYILEQALGEHVYTYTYIFVFARVMINIEQKLIQNTANILSPTSHQRNRVSPLLLHSNNIPPLFPLQLRMMHRLRPRPLNPLHHRRRPIRANLREPAHLPRVKPQRNHRVAPAALRLGHDPADGVVPRRVELSSRQSQYRERGEGERTKFVNHRNSPPATLLSTMPRLAAQLRLRTVRP